jgi:hypothetical protein
MDAVQVLNLELAQHFSYPWFGCFLAWKGSIPDAQLIGDTLLETEFAPENCNAVHCRSD